MKTGAEAHQEGGTHYKGMKVEPLRFAMQNGWDACAFSILKYVSRHRLKGGKLDLEKALHYVGLRQQLWGPWLYPRRHLDNIIPMAAYLTDNQINGREADILFDLEAWVNDNSKTGEKATNMIASLQALMNEYDTAHLRGD